MVGWEKIDLKGNKIMNFKNYFVSWGGWAKWEG
jgi:hypothetical protein